MRNRFVTKRTKWKGNGLFLLKSLTICHKLKARGTTVGRNTFCRQRQPQPRINQIAAYYDTLFRCSLRSGWPQAYDTRLYIFAISNRGGQHFGRNAWTSQLISQGWLWTENRKSISSVVFLSVFTNKPKPSFFSGRFFGSLKKHKTGKSTCFCFALFSPRAAYTIDACVSRWKPR